MKISRPTPEQSFGLRVKELRTAIPLTQEELAESAGLFRNYISRVESGLANPTVRVIHALAEALRVEASELFKPAQPAPKKVRTVNPISRGRVVR